MATVQDLQQGPLELRHRIAQRYLRHGARVSPDEIIITSGALEALNLCLQAVARPVIPSRSNSPTFYGCLNALEAYGLRALEIPTHPKYGVDLDALRRALDGAPVRACWFMTAFQNPLGSSVPAAAKRELVKLLEARNVPLIEDHVYGELHYGLCRRSRPKRLIGVAWCLNAAHSRSAWRRAPRRLGGGGSLCRSSAPTQAHEQSGNEQCGARCDSSVLRTGVYERHLRQLRRVLAKQQSAALESLHDAS